MEFDDFKIGSEKDMERMARAYHDFTKTFLPQENKIKDFNDLAELVEEIGRLMNFVADVYERISEYVKNPEFKSYFLNFREKTLEDFSEFSVIFPSSNNNVRTDVLSLDELPKNLFSLLFKAVEVETDLLQKIFRLQKKCENDVSFIFEGRVKMIKAVISNF